MLAHFETPAYKLSLSNKDMKKVAESGFFRLMVGESGTDIVLSGRFQIQ